MRLIDADKLQEFPVLANRCDKEHANKHFLNGIETVLEYAEQLPTVDAEVVVRCKDCKYSYADLEGLCCTYGPPIDTASYWEIMAAYMANGGQAMANKDAMLESLEEIENGMCRIKERRSIWQNSLIYALCQAVRLLLIDKIKEARK